MLLDLNSSSAEHKVAQKNFHELFKNLLAKRTLSISLKFHLVSKLATEP